MKSPKLITVTLRKGVTPKKNLERLWPMRNALFHKLRDKGYKIFSHFSVVEFPNHIHMVVDCDYIPQNLLSKYWKTITGDSYIVDVRKINLPRSGPRATVRYITKYLTKGADVDTLSIEDLKGFHVISSWRLGEPSTKVPMTCLCGSTGHFKLLFGNSVDAYLSWWEKYPSGPPAS